MCFLIFVFFSWFRRSKPFVWSFAATLAGQKLLRHALCMRTEGPWPATSGDEKRLWKMGMWRDVLWAAGLLITFELGPLISELHCIFRPVLVNEDVEWPLACCVFGSNVWNPTLEFSKSQARTILPGTLVFRMSADCLWELNRERRKRGVDRFCNWVEVPGRQQDWDFKECDR